MSASANAVLAANNAPFQGRVNYCLSIAAVNVASEAANEVGHTLRTAYALKVLSGQVNIPAVALVVVGNATISAEINLEAADFNIPDGDLQFTVNALFSGLAGVVN